jgi:glycosyltransferase involved in cell wall biosynthesis
MQEKIAETIYPSGHKQNKYKIAIIAPVPFYYHVPLYRRLNNSSEIDLMVYYCSDETLRGADVEKMYCTKSRLADPENLLNGYNYKFLKNYSPRPSFMYWPFGLINFGIWKEIKKENYNAVVLQSWTNLTWWLAFFACLRFNAPIFLTTDSNLSNEYLNSKIKTTFKKIILGKLFFKKTTAFLVGGKANEDYYKYYGAPDKKMVRFPHWWGYEQFFEKAKKIKPEKENLRESFGITKNDFVLLFVGRLVQEKNILALLDAYKRVDYKNKRLFIVGDGPLRSQIEKRIKDLKIHGVSLKGFQQRESLIKFYVISDVLVLPSEKEPWGMVVNEAMCFGLPIIASDRVGAAVDIVRDGYNGFIFPSNNVEKLAHCIKKLINLTPTQRQTFSEESFKIINKWVNAIDPEQQMLKILKLLKKLKKYEKNN